MSDEQKPPRRINPRYRAYGKARIDAAQRVQSQNDWERLWKPAPYPFPFVWGQHWKCSIEYQVDDFAAEIGFLIDVLGLPVNAFNPGIAMFTSPDHEFYFAVVPTPPDGVGTPPGAIRIQFMVEDVFSTHEEFVRRGVVFEHAPQPISEGSLQWVATFFTPNGIAMEIWGQVEMVAETPAGSSIADNSEEEQEPEEEAPLPSTWHVSERPNRVVQEDLPDPSEEIELYRKPGKVVQSKPPETPLEPKSRPAQPAQVLPEQGLTRQNRPEQKPPVKPAPPTAEKQPVARPSTPTAGIKPPPPTSSIKPAASPAIKPPAAAQPPLPVFKSGKEMLEHLQQKAARNSNQTAASTFHPAPKPTPGKLEADEALEYEDLDADLTPNSGYDPISFDSSEDEI